MMQNDWMRRVSEYLDSLQSCVETLNEALDETRVGTMTMEALRVSDGSGQLASGLVTLEERIAARQLLLDADDAPIRGVSLRDVLNRCQLSGAPLLADRCHALSREMERCRERAVALFVCQFHLSEMSSHLLALLRGGADEGVTYEHGKSDVKRIQTTSSVFNRAA